MKKLLFSVFALAAILGVSSVSAQKTTLTVEKLWSITQPGGGAARQGFGMDGALYYHQQGTGVYKVTAAAAAPELVISKEVTGIAAHAVAKDDVGNIVIFGSTDFPTSATTINFIYVQKKGETTGVRITSPTLEGFNRTDFIAAAGDVFSAEGGHLYLINNDGKAAYDITIVNGTTATVTPIEGMTLAGNQNAMIDVHNGIYHYAAAGLGVYSFDGTTATKVNGLTNIQAQCLGTTHFTLAGKEIWAYHVGGSYTSEFKILNKTDNNFVTDSEGNTVFVLNDASKTTGGVLRGVWLNAEQIDDNTYLLYAWHSHDGGAVYKVSAVVAATVALECDTTMGTVEGAGDYAVGSNATVKAIPALNHSFVAWKIGNAVVSTDAEYTFTVTGNVALTAVFQAEDNKTLTLSVNDETKGYIALPGGIVMGENTVAYGTQVTLTAVPAEGATFNGWYNADTLYAADYTIELVMTADLALTANFIDVLKVEYILNGGVTNKHGWLSKAHMCLDFQNDYNTAYHSSKAWAKEENGIVYYYIKGEWKLPEEVEGTDAGIDGFLQAVTYNTSDNLVKLLQTEKWLPLGDYINSLRTAAGNAIADETAMRAELSGFFLNSPALTDYRHTNDYSIAGQPSVFCPAMKMGFDNPTEVARQVTLNDPYNPYLDFVGWYTNAEFTGEKVTVLNPKSVIPDGKLYAKYEGYIPTIAEVLAMEEDSVTLISGIVNWVRNNNVFIQDATGGFLLYGTDLAPEVGTKILAQGTRDSFNGKPQLSNAVLVSSEEGKLFAPVDASLATLLADTTSLKYFGQRVQVLGVYVAEYDSYGNLWVADLDGSNKIQCYRMTPDQAKFPIGKKISLTAVASSNNGVFQFEGDVAGIEAVVIGVKEEYDYPTRYEKYTLTNNWIISNNEDNFALNKPGTSMSVRGMAAKDGIMYFINRETESIVRVNGETGDMLEPIKIISDHLFSVGEGKTVAFSSGNLQYHPKNDEWRFAENQWNYVGITNSNIASDYDGWIDLFGWGTGDAPTKSSTDYSDYQTFIDWGTNQIGNNAPNTWRTLTNDEWEYLLWYRENAQSLFGLGNIDGVNGVILLPDNWVLPDGLSFKNNTDEVIGSIYWNVSCNDNVYTSEQWVKMERAGAIFLPAAGYRIGVTTQSINSEGVYWSATNSESYAYSLNFHTSALNPSGLDAAYYSRSVRLVKDTEGENSDVTTSTTLPFNDIKFDWAGNCLIGACVSASATCQPFMIHTVDLETGKATELINDVLWDNPDLDQEVFRFDAFGVAGDVTKDGVVMAADATTGNWLAYRWVVKDGKASEGEQVSIMLDAAKDQSLFLTAAGFGTAPQIFPVDELGELFYVDGFNTLPMLFYGNPEEGAILIDDFIKVPTGRKVWNAEGDTLSMNYGHNGLVEFQVGEEYFLLMAASSHGNDIPSSFALYKFADADRAFAGMEPLWYFPAKGMGSTTNGCRTAVPSVEVIDEKTAILYLYTQNNGYASYTFSIDTKQDVTTSVEEHFSINNGVEKLLRNGQLLIIRDGKTYNVMGAEMK